MNKKYLVTYGFQANQQVFKQLPSHQKPNTVKQFAPSPGGEGWGEENKK
jgi:hypothetical protein